MSLLYLDLFSGISGDMFLGALVDLGVDAQKLEGELKKLKIDGWHLRVARKEKSGIAGVKLDVQVTEHRKSRAKRREHEPGRATPHTSRVTHHHDGRNFAEIKRLISHSGLSSWVKKKSIAVFQRIAVAEGKIHGERPAKVHFHEIGAIDSIVDIVGACAALEMLGKPRVLASPVIEGTGWIDCEHGCFPVPAPATLAILGARGVGLTQCNAPHELVTPTGAALLAEFAETFGPMQNLVAEKTGFGLGTRVNQTKPNVLRAVIGKSDQWRDTRGGRFRRQAKSRHSSDWETDHIIVLETNLDDTNSEILGHFMEAALADGALDVFYAPIQMKKNRPGVLLTILCIEADGDKFSEMILRETSSFGVRRTLAERRKLRRKIAQVSTRFGKVEVKLGIFNDTVLQAAPEFESCKRLARRAKVPLKQVYAAAGRAIDARKFC